jgi:hypothetical protein
VLHLFDAVAPTFMVTRPQRSIEIDAVESSISHFPFRIGKHQTTATGMVQIIDKTFCTKCFSCCNHLRFNWTATLDEW